ncbi:MAG: toll/interleukin-1 receptor domain-containing protein [Verrucomicrobiales bacterium]
MTFPEARDTVLALLRQKGRVRNSEMLALLGGDTALLEKIREDLLSPRWRRMFVARACATETNLPVRSDEGTDLRKIFLSYGRRDTSGLADRLERDLQASGYQIWRDTHEINPGAGWQEEITEGLQSAESSWFFPTSTLQQFRTASNREAVDSVCLGKLPTALFQPPASLSSPSWPRPASRRLPSFISTSSTFAAGRTAPNNIRRDLTVFWMA